MPKLTVFSRNAPQALILRSSMKLRWDSESPVDRRKSRIRRFFLSIGPNIV